MVWTLSAGVYNLAFGLFHLTFWRLLRWQEQLPRLSPTNRAVLQTLNICLTFCFLLAAYLLLVHADEIHSSGIGKAVAVGTLLFWILRAVLQLVLFEMHQGVHRLLLGLFVVGIILHGAVIWAQTGKL